MARSFGFPASAAIAVLLASACAWPEAGLCAVQEARLKQGAQLPTTKRITPLAARGAVFQNLRPGWQARPRMHANHAAAVKVSPDGRLISILTTGDNVHFAKDGSIVPDLSTEYVFVFDVHNGRPRQVATVPVPNTFHGLAWSTDSKAIYVAGGKDDLVREYRHEGARFFEARTFALRHASPAGADGIPPMANQLAVSPNGRWLIVSNMTNDSVSLIDLVAGALVTEQDLRPGKIDPKDRGKPGGTVPGSVVWVSNDSAYVASERDRELIQVQIKGQHLQVLSRTPVEGKPVAVTANRRGTRLYVALDNTDRVAVIDTISRHIVENIDVVAPRSVYFDRRRLGGANPTSLVLAPTGDVLLVTNGGQNSVSVVRLGAAAADVHAARDAGKGEESASPSAVVGLLPTGWYPTGIDVSHDGSQIYVVNAKGLPGPNSEWCGKPANQTCYGSLTPAHPWASKAGDGNLRVFAQNGFAFQSTEDSTVLLRERAGFLAFPAPNDKELAQLTRQVAANNGFDRSDKTEADKRLFAELRRHIKHVVYIVKENRSYDQILGDLEIGDGDPRLTLFPESLTPNHHALARIFVVLDNFLVSGEGSWTGWQWSTAGRTSVFAERNDFVNLAQRGGGDRQEPLNPSDPDDLAGDRDADEFDGPHGELGQGYLWDSALRAGKTVRSYGFWAWSNKSPALREPFREGVKTAVTTIPSLAPYSDPYMPPAIRVPDFWRIREWKREFDGYIKSGDLPDLVLIQLPGDHFGQYQTVLDGVDTPDKQMADNDYALGTIIEAVAKSRFADSTLVIAIEDDTWDGVDHVDAFRSPIFLAGPYVKQGGTLISTRYTTVNVIKTITELLGAGPVSINDAIATPMTEVFDLSRQNWTYQANVPDILYSTKLPLPPRSGSIASCVLNAEHDAAYWAKAMAEQDDSHIDAGRFGTGNQALWLGLKGDQPYPETRTGENLRSNRDVLLAASRAKVREICLGTRGLVRASSPFPGGEVPQK